MEKVLNLIQLSLRKIIDWLISLWIWVNKHRLEAEERKENGR